MWYVMELFPLRNGTEPNDFGERGPASAPRRLKTEDAYLQAFILSQQGALTYLSTDVWQYQRFSNVASLAFPLGDQIEFLKECVVISATCVHR
jgi:hypothetical protein